MQGLLRDGVLDGQRVATCGPVRPEIADRLAELGARTLALDPDLADEAATDAAARALGEVDALVVDGAALAAGSQDPLRAAADGAWSAARAIANAAWIEPGRAGKLVLVAPPGDEAARAAYENLARTLSIEWSRYGIRIGAITPETTPDGDVATLVAYLVSPAGDYFSGARLDLV